MIISFNWIDELVSLHENERDPDALARRLTLTAAAVEKVEAVGTGLDGIVAARVLEARPHPNADRLTLCRVDAGGGEPLDVVCGAPVVEPGAVYAHVGPGVTLPGGLRIERRRIRGEESHGMLCSEVELELGRDKGGIMRLPGDLEPGAPLAQALGLPDTRLTLDLNPNRVDLACHLGVAREVGGPPRLRNFGGPRWRPEWQDGDTQAQAAGVTVRIEDLAQSSRYLAAVIRGVRVGPSPGWLAGRLLAVGARPISNVVDATNYVLMERNQPLHAFDLATLAGPEIRVRAARAGEALTTLDGQEHRLAPEQTVIADRERPVALAGVMGGLDTEVTAGTTDLLIECAAFDPAGVRRTRAPAGLSTDASYRFERGIDVHAQEEALIRCVELILATAGGEAEPVAVRTGPAPAASEPIELRTGRVNQVLGFGLNTAQVAGALEPIGFAARPDGEDRVRVSVPGWRTDVAREIDLVEEVARRVGYDAAPGQDRRFRPSVVKDDPRVERAARIRRHFASRGLLEARSLSFMPGDFRGSRAAVPVPNPLSAEEGWLRSAMVPVLLRRLEHNYARGHRAVRLFELGTVFGLGGAEPGPEAGAGGFVEVQRVGTIITGARSPEHWAEDALDFDLWDIKEMAETFAHRLCGAELHPLEVGAAAGGRDEQHDEPGGTALGPAGSSPAGSPAGGRSEQHDEHGGTARGPEGSSAAGSTGGGPAGREPTGAPPLGGTWLSGGGFLAVKDGRPVGIAGAVRPESADLPVWAAPVYALEFDLDAVEQREPSVYRAASPFPALRRDLSMTVPAGVTSAEVERAVREAARELLGEVRLFDVYSGEETGGRLGMAWALHFRAPDRTLTDAEVEAPMSAIFALLEERYGARIRRS